MSVPDTNKEPYQAVQFWRHFDRGMAAALDYARIDKSPDTKLSREAFVQAFCARYEGFFEPAAAE